MILFYLFKCENDCELKNVTDCCVPYVYDCCENLLKKISSIELSYIYNNNSAFSQVRRFVGF